MTLPAIQELRALDVFDSIPAGLQTAYVDDDRNWPHLRRGEAAVFDPKDREPVHGELFVFEYSNGHRSISSTERRLMKGVWLTRDDPGDLTVARWWWWTCPLNRPTGDETIDDWLRQRRQLYLSDGPCGIDVLRRNIIGRVIGVSLGQEAL